MKFDGSEDARSCIGRRMMRCVRNGSFSGPIAEWLRDENGGSHVPHGGRYAAAAHIDLDLEDGSGCRLLLSHDVGHHASGWFKNPDYDACFHLSISFRYPALNQPLPMNHAEAAKWVSAIFGDSRRYLWTESPKGPEGKHADVWHYRVFVDSNMEPILPRGEVYSRDLTKAGWMSYTEVTDVMETA